MRWFTRGEKLNEPSDGLGKELICPNCGTVNPPTARFCNQCGHALALPRAATTPIERPSSVVPSPGARPVEDEVHGSTEELHSFPTRRSSDLNRKSVV